MALAGMMVAGCRFLRLGRCLFPRFRNSKLKRRSANTRACASVKRKRKDVSLCTPEGYGILKRKEAMAALDLLALTDAPGGMDILMDRWMEMQASAAAEEAAARRLKKRKRVLKERLPNALIEHMAASPFRTIEDLTPLQLSKCSPHYRQLHAVTSFVDGKMRDYEQALIDQYNAQGYAEDEREVTDDEEDDTVDNE